MVPFESEFSCAFTFSQHNGHLSLCSCETDSRSDGQYPAAVHGTQGCSHRHNASVNIFIGGGRSTPIRSTCVQKPRIHPLAHGEAPGHCAAVNARGDALSPPGVTRAQRGRSQRTQRPPASLPHEEPRAVEKPPQRKRPSLIFKIHRALCSLTRVPCQNGTTDGV